MGRDKNSKTLKKDDFSITEDEDICYFTEESKPEGQRVSLFSFDGSSPQYAQEAESNVVNLNNAENKADTARLNENNSNVHNNPESLAVYYSELSKSSKKILDNIQTKVDFGSLPDIDGEPADVRRSYGLRHSTVVKIDAIKNAHSKTCVSVSTVVDMAIAYFYDCIFKN